MAEVNFNKAISSKRKVGKGKENKFYVLILLQFKFMRKPEGKIKTLSFPYLFCGQCIFLLWKVGNEVYVAILL